jgi:predicted porin
LAATSAFAQSSVTISGNVDLGYRSVTQNGTNSANVVTSRKTSNVAGNGAEGWTSSQVTLKVVEDMGNGTVAGYTNEMNLASLGTGADASGDSLGTIRQSFVSLANAKNGEFRLGYQYTLEDQIQGGVGRATPTGNVGGRVQNFAFSVNPAAAASTLEGSGTLTSGHITRANAFQYASPTMSGFQALVQFAQVTDKTNNGTANEQSTKAKISAIAGRYSQGPLNLGLSYQSTRSEDNTLGAANSEKKIKTSATQLAANYDFGPAKVFLNTFSRKSDVTEGIGHTTALPNFAVFNNGGTLKRTGTDLGVSAPFGSVTLFASVGSGKYKADQDGTGAVANDLNIKAHLLGATYDLSKRTSLNAYYATAKVTADYSSNELSKKTIGAGLRHSF